MPGVLNRYIKYEAAGDQFVGKCVSGRKRTSTKFAASPAYFDCSALDSEERMENEEQLSIWLKDRMPKDAKKNLNVFGLFKMCVAVISFHRNFLNENMHSDCMFWSAPLWNETVLFAKYVEVRYPWTSTSMTPVITGIPPDIVLLNGIERLKEMMTDLNILGKQDRLIPQQRGPKHAIAMHVLVQNLQ